ncbi:hypothetical protein ABC733_06735 [Mangrovibacter sp. SLW1]
MKKDNKSISVGVRLTPTQAAVLQKMVDAGKAKTISAAIQYLINVQGIQGND